MSESNETEKDWLLSLTLHGARNQSWVGGVRLQHHAKAALIARWDEEESTALRDRAAQWIRERERTTRNSIHQQKMHEQEVRFLQSSLVGVHTASQEALQAQDTNQAWGWCTTAVWQQTRVMESAIQRLGLGGARIAARTFTNAKQGPEELVELAFWGKCSGVQDAQTARLALRAAFTGLAQFLAQAGAPAKRDTYWLLNAAPLPPQLNAQQVLATLERQALQRMLEARGAAKGAKAANRVGAGDAGQSKSQVPGHDASTPRPILDEAGGAGGQTVESQTGRRAKRL